MPDERSKVSGELFRDMLARMDALTRAELMELRTEGKCLSPESCSPAYYYVVLALGDMAGGGAYKQGPHGRPSGLSAQTSLIFLHVKTDL